MEQRSGQSSLIGLAETRASQAPHVGVVAAMESVYRESPKDLPSPRLSAPVGVTPPRPAMTPAELAMALRYTPPAAKLDVQPACAPTASTPSTVESVPQVVVPPSLGSAMNWQVGVRTTPLQPSAQAFDGFRARFERGQPKYTTLDVRVTENNGRDVKAVPERELWRGSMRGKRIADAVRSVRQGITGFADLASFMALAHPRLDSLVARWQRLPATPARSRVTEALAQLSTALQSAERLLSRKDVSAAQPCEREAMQADRALLLSRGRA